jgi:hypothetical protein
MLLGKEDRVRFPGVFLSGTRKNGSRDFTKRKTDALGQGGDVSHKK